MRADRPLLVSAAFLGAGLWLIFRYGISGGGVNAALPWSNVGFHVNVAASGPAAIGGAVLTGVGLLLLLWSILAALAWHASLLVSRHDDEEDFLRILPPLAADAPLSDGPEEGVPASISGPRSFL